jgi:hypothetical protein
MHVQDEHTVFTRVRAIYEAFEVLATDREIHMCTPWQVALLESWLLHQLNNFQRNAEEAGLPHLED